MGESIRRQDKTRPGRTRAVKWSPHPAIGAALHHIAPQRKGLPVTAYRLGAVFTLAAAIAFSAQAQIIVNGNDFPKATPTNGSFSIRIPISYKDIEHKGAETRVGDVKELR